jgi:predicted nucleic acid-binding protein
LRLFIDSGPLIAKYNKKDPYYAQIKSVFDKIQAKEIEITRIFTSNLVIGEALTHILYATHSLEYCQKVLNLVEQTRYLDTIFIDREMDAAARTTFLKYFDQDLSFVDCTNISLMKEYKIGTIFTIDSTFKNLGFACLP